MDATVKGNTQRSVCPFDHYSDANTDETITRMGRVSVAELQSFLLSSRIFSKTKDKSRSLHFLVIVFTDDA